MQGRFDSQISSTKGEKAVKYGKSLNATHHFFNVRKSGGKASRMQKDQNLLINHSGEVSNSVNLGAMSRVSTQ